MKKRIFYFLKSYLGFTKRESRGFFLLVPILFLLVLAPEFYNWYLNSSAEKEYEGYLIAVRRSLEGHDEWSGNSAKQIAVSAIKQKESKNDTSRWKRASKEPPNLKKLAFSEADSILLQIVPGIGETLAGRIVKFRDNLGGLYQREQLLEVYGLREEVAKRIFDYFTFDPAIKSKLPINSLSVKELSRHPYVKYGEAKVIVAYREQHGKYNSAEELLDIKIFTEEWLDRLEPYLTFE